MMALMLLGIAALAVDVGSGLSRASDVQGQADFAALSAASTLAGQTSGTVPAAVVGEVRDSLNANRPLNRDACPADDQPSSPCITNAQLTNASYLDGAVWFCTGPATPHPTCKEPGLQVVAPQARVDFGFGNAFGISDTDVQASATIAVLSPLGALPVFAVSPCDYGRQTVTDPANGHVTPVTIPTLASDTDTNTTTLSQVAVNQVALNAVGTTLTLSGSRWTNTIKVGFFPSDGGAPVEATAFNDDATVNHPNTATPVRYTTNGGSSRNIQFSVPLAVSTRELVWYIRVFNTTSPTVMTGQWSAKATAQAFRVGEPVLECNAGSSDGNFGTLKFPRSDVSSTNDQAAMNMATNLQKPLSLTTHTAWNSSGLCTDGLSGAVTSALPNPGLRAGTNCVDTDTGLPALAATAGMITGDHIPAPGRLVSKPTTDGCDRNGGSSEHTVTIHGTDYALNDDVLTCFLTNGTVSLADIANRNYVGDAVLDDSIYASPRFFFVPVLHVQPSNGGSNRYSIVDFRPAFLTDETVAASTIRGTSTATTDNGVTIAQNQIKTMKVIFFNTNALPSRTSGGVTTYFGVGPRIIRLVD